MVMQYTQRCGAEGWVWDPGTRLGLGSRLDKHVVMAYGFSLATPYLIAYWLVCQAAPLGEEGVLAVQ